MPADRSLAGRHAVITGASRGIGAAIAATLAELGTQTTLIGRDRAALERQSGRYPGAVPLVCDVLDRVQVEHAFAQAARRAPVDILVNNAGAAESAPLHRTSDELVERMYAINVASAFRCARAVLPSMLERGFGRIVNIASVAGLHGYAYVTAYCAAKHALVGFTRALAAETGAGGVTVNAVCPGYTDTEMVQKAAVAIAAKTGRSESQALQEMADKNPRRRLIRPEEVANTVAWLCGSEASSVNGQAIAVAGGEIS